MERTEYAAMLPALAPGQAVDLLNDRVSHIGKLNSEISDWLADRRRLEDLYANGLRKLARRQMQGIDLGIFSVPWTTVMGATDTQADSHASLASKIEVDVERPLREYVRQSREVQAMSSMQGNLNALARDVENAQQKLEKLQNKGDTNNMKLAGANSELEQAQGQWDSQASYVFENLQALDEARWSHLRDIFTQLQTHEVDQIEKDRVSAEQCLNVLLNVEIADEIKTFSLKAVAGRPPRAERPSRQPSLPIPSPGTITAASSSRPNLAPTLSQTSEGQRSASIQDDEKKEKKGPLKSLKRFSTVMGRKKDRSSKLPSQLESMAENPEPKGKSSLFGRRKKEEAPSIEPPPTTSTQRPYSPLRVGSEAFEPAALREAHPTATPPSGYHNGLNGVAEGAAVGAGLGSAAGALHILNGHQGDLADLEPPAASQAAPSSPAFTQTSYANQAPAQSSSQAPAQSSFASQAPTQSPFGSQSQSTFASQPPAPTVQQRDSEGYSVPSNEVDAITRAQQEAAGASDNAALSYNVNIRDAPIAEDKGVDADAALASMQSKLLQQQAPPPQRRAGTVRGRRDNRNSAYYAPADIPVVLPTAELPRTAEVTPTTTSFEPSASTTSTTNAALPPPPAFNPSASTSSAFSTLPAAQEASPFKPVSRNLTTDSTADNQSIRSGKSLSSTTSQGNKHPELTGVGLNASILETISARFENGKAAGSSLVGEIALAYHAPDFTTPFGTENIKLENFSLLDKIAPNPAIITPSAAGKDGEYTVNLATLGKTQLVLKYQARSEDTSALAPLLITPAFKIEASQASVIVNYSLNPSFALPASSSITLSNVMLALTLEGAKATSCQSKPVGTFSKDKNMIFWQLGDIVLRPGASPEKLLARFATESEAKAGSVEARWEVTGEKVTGLGSSLAVSVQHQPAATDGADPFADEDGQAAAAQWKTVNSVKKLVSGNYSAR